MHCFPSLTSGISSGMDRSVHGTPIPGTLLKLLRKRSPLPLGLQRYEDMGPSGHFMTCVDWLPKNGTEEIEKMSPDNMTWVLDPTNPECFSFWTKAFNFLHKHVKVELLHLSLQEPSLMQLSFYRVSVRMLLVVVLTNGQITGIIPKGLLFHWQEVQGWSSFRHSLIKVPTPLLCDPLGFSLLHVLVLVAARGLQPLHHNRIRWSEAENGHLFQSVLLKRRLSWSPSADLPSSLLARTGSCAHS